MKIPKKSTTARTLASHGWEQVTEARGRRERVGRSHFHRAVPGSSGGSFRAHLSFNRMGGYWFVDIDYYDDDRRRGIILDVRMDDPVSLSTYFMMVGDGDVNAGIRSELDNLWTM